MAFFPSLKQNFIAYRSSEVSSRPDCIFEIHQLWQSGFSRVYSNCCSSCSFEAKIINIGQSSHKKYSNNILNFQESMIILNVCTRKVKKLIECTTYILCLENINPFWISHCYWCLEYADCIFYRPTEGVSWVWHKTASNGEALVLEPWGYRVIFSLVLLPGPLWPGMLVPVRVPSMN